MTDLATRSSLLALRLRKAAWMMRRPRWRPLLRAGFGPSLEHAKIFRGQRFSTVLDIGANNGQFAAWADDALAPSMIHCFEPQHSTLLADVAARCGAEVQIHEVALGQAAGKAVFNVTAAADSSSLLRPHDAAVESHRGLAVRHTVSVDVVPGDDVLNGELLCPPILMKIDVQGTETAVLRGLPATLAKTDAVLVELSLGQMYEAQSELNNVVGLLAESGFRSECGAPVPGTSASRLEQIDVLFRRAT